MYHSSTAGVVRMQGASQQGTVSLKSCVAVRVNAKKTSPGLTVEVLETGEKRNLKIK